MTIDYFKLVLVAISFLFAGGFCLYLHYRTRHISWEEPTIIIVDVRGAHIKPGDDIGIDGKGWGRVIKRDGNNLTVRRFK